MTPTKDVNTHNSPEPRKHTMKGDKGKDMERAWCDECGCGIWIRPGGDTEKMFLKAGKYSASGLVSSSHVRCGSIHHIFGVDVMTK